jgi:hypothetical protein
MLTLIKTTTKGAFMTLITKDEFYKLIGPRDICVSSSHEKNESYFKTRSGVLVGICKNIETENDYIKEYYIDIQVLPPEIKD